MPNFDIACVESRIQGPRDYYSKFIIESMVSFVAYEGTIAGVVWQA